MWTWNLNWKPLFFIPKTGRTMERKRQPLHLEICMGSSCFSRGNRYSLQILREFIREQGLEDWITIEGRLCSGSCSKGPVININGREYPEVHPDSVKDLILHVLEGGNK